LAHSESLNGEFIAVQQENVGIVEFAGAAARLVGVGFRVTLNTWVAGARPSPRSALRTSTATPQRDTGQELLGSFCEASGWKMSTLGGAIAGCPTNILTMGGMSTALFLALRR